MREKLFSPELNSIAMSLPSTAAILALFLLLLPSSSSPSPVAAARWTQNSKTRNSSSSTNSGMSSSSVFTRRKDAPASDAVDKITVERQQQRTSSQGFLFFSAETLSDFNQHDYSPVANSNPAPSPAPPHIGF